MDQKPPRALVRILGYSALCSKLLLGENSSKIKLTRDGEGNPTSQYRVRRISVLSKRDSISHRTVYRYNQTLLFRGSTWLSKTDLPG